MEQENVIGCMHAHHSLPGAGASLCLLKANFRKGVEPGQAGAQHRYAYGSEDDKQEWCDAFAGPLLQGCCHHVFVLSSFERCCVPTSAF